MSDQSLRNRLRERAKLTFRTGLMRLDLDLSRDPWTKRVARMAAARGIDTVLDVGANVGQYGALLRSAGYAGRLVSLEPLAGAFGELSKRAHGDPSWTCVNAAVGDDGEAVMNVAANSYSSSLLPMTDAHLEAAPDSRYVAQESVRVVSVRTLATEHAVDPARTLLKIDTQGYESQVLDSAGDLLGRFAAVQVELSLVELYAGQALMPELLERLDGAGLSLFAVEPGFSGEDGRMLQIDGLLVRDRSDR